MNQSERRIWLLRALLSENKQYSYIEIPNDVNAQKKLIRGLMNIRTPRKLSDELIKIQDEYLKYEIYKKGITDIDMLTPTLKCENIYIWQGDITSLRCDAIVNAANGGMTGCYCPNHGCIDNCIHTYAGMQLRLFCDEIMKKQGCQEQTGRAKITPAFNLPSKYIIHTVGPIIQEVPTEKDLKLLADCYNSCLALAAENSLESIAFCCISTGEFHFPNDIAAEIAVDTVRSFLKQDSSVKKVIFNVFKAIDKEIYEQLLG